MTNVVVTESNDSTIIQQQDVYNLVVEDTAATIIVTGMMGPAQNVSFQNNPEVDLTNLQNGGILVYNASNQKWTATNLLQNQIVESGQF
jgi:hypothetical protein